MEGKAIYGKGTGIAATVTAGLHACVGALLLVAVPTVAQTVPFTGAGSQFEMVFWQSVDSGNDPALYEAYLAKYPDGTFSGVARAKLARLRPVNPAGPINAPAAMPALNESPAPTVQLSAPALKPVLAAPSPTPLAPVVTALTSPAPGQLAAPPPPQSASEIENRDALRRLLGALGDSQRIAQPAAPPSASAAAERRAELVPVAAVSAIPGAAPLPGPISEPLQVIAVGPLPSGFALPQRPALAEVPGVALPPSFCSAEARNQFHNGPYMAAVEAAKRNTDASNAYMRQLQELYDRNQLNGDINPMNALAAEARAYGPVASAAFAAQSGLVSTFNTLMAVPIVACEVPK